MDAVYDPEAFASELIPEPGTPVSSSLEDLRAAMECSEQVAEVEFADHRLYGPGGHIALVCSTELDQAELKRIQLTGLPREQRRKRLPDPRKMDEVAVLATLIARQTIRIELLQPDGSYRAVPGDLSDPALLAQLGVMDPAMAVRRVFGNRDALIMRAGQELINACGYGEDGPDGEGDPT